MRRPRPVVTEAISEADVLPVVRSIQIFPFKSLDGQAVDQIAVSRSGSLQGDRAFALADASGALVTAKRHPAVQRLRSHVDVATARLHLHDETHHGLGRRDFDLRHERAAVADWLATMLGFDVSLREDRETGFPDDGESPGPTVISTATLAETASWFELPIEEMRARLRTNIEIDGVPPFWEDRLFGGTGTTIAFSIGDVEFLGVNPCQRCAVPARNPRTGEMDPSFSRLFAERRRATFPIWADSERFDHFYRVAVNTRLEAWRPGSAIRVGDVLRLRGRVG